MCSNNANIVHERVGDTSSGQPERLSSSERIQRALEILWVGRISLLDFLIKIFDPNEPEHALYRDRMYTLPKGANGGKLAKLLDVIYEDKRGRQQLSHWMEPYAIELVTKKVYSEMDGVKIAMRGTIDLITPGFLRDWNFVSSMDDIANQLCPTLYRILRTASQTESAKEKNTIKSGRTVCAVVIAQLAKQRSNHSLLFAAPFTLFAWVNGASRQTIEALYQCGLAISFTSLLKLLNNLATRCIEDATHAALDAHVFCYDNINISTSIHVEQRALAPAKVQSGTFPILYATRNGNLEHMRLSPMLHHAQQASDLVFATDIRLTLDQIQTLHHQFRVHVVKILFRNSVFKDYQHKSDPVFQHRPRQKLPSGWKTKQYPLRTSTIDESSVTGNIAVINDVYMNQLKMTHEQLSDRAIPCINDQSTNARIRGAKALRTQDVNPFTRLSCFQLVPGLFHLSMNLIWALLHIHRGSIHQLGSLSYFFAVLDRTQLGGEHPDYHQGYHPSAVTTCET